MRTDVLVKLPDGRTVVVDSKVNLVAWEQAMNAQTPEEQIDALQRHAVALKQHVKDLGDKNYPKAVGPNTLEITIAFVPIEGALSAALGTDTGLQVYAFERKIAFASPNTLMALLRVVERLWTRDKLQSRAVEISEAGGRILDAISRFLEEFDGVGKSLNSATEAFSQARHALIDSPQAVMPRARKLVALGVRGKKALKEEMLPDEGEVAALVLATPDADSANGTSEATA
jgi:DNA recombination protein RmuC